jgi:site-specific DNA recombinase
MPDAPERQIEQAAENLQAYLTVLYRIFLERKDAERMSDSREPATDGRVQKRAPSSDMNNYYGYIRVSTAKQGEKGSSLQEQKASIEEFAQRQGFDIVQWFEERETAAKRGRGEFKRMMSSLERGKATGVILHKIDRGARNLWDWARIQDLIDAGIEVHFAHDNLDLKSRGGRLAADIQAVVAADYVRNLREEVRKGMRGRLKQGLYPLHAPVGYLDQGSAKAKIIDPIKGPLVRVAFTLYASKRYTYRSLAAELHRRGLRQSNGKALSMSGMATILRNPFYIGILRLKSTGETFQGIHETLVDASVFRLVQDIIDEKTNTAVRRFEFRYKRLLKCGMCASVLTGELQKGRTYYRCHTKGCETTGVREDVVDARFLLATKALRFTDKEIEQMVSSMKELARGWLAERAELVASLKLHVAALEQRERRITDAYIDQALDRDAYFARKSALLLELADARQEMKRIEGGSIGSGAIHLQEFFELVKTFELKPECTSALVYRDAVETLTSNRTLLGKNLSIAIRSPFQEIIDNLDVFCGGLRRSTFRTCTSHSTATERSAPLVDRKVHEKRARILSKHLADWKPPPSISDAVNANKSKRKLNRSWFEPKLV